MSHFLQQEMENANVVKENFEFVSHKPNRKVNSSVDKAGVPAV